MNDQSEPQDNMKSIKQEEETFRSMTCKREYSLPVSCIEIIFGSNIISTEEKNPV